MNSAIGWRAPTFGFSAFADTEDLGDYWGEDAAAAEENTDEYNQLIDDYWSDQASTDPSGNTSTPAKSGWGDAASGFLTDVWKNVGQGAVNNVISSSIYGDPTGYITTADGKQVPYWGAKNSPFTLSPTGQKINLPPDTSNKWIVPAIIGGAALIGLVLFMSMRRR